MPTNRPSFFVEGGRGVTGNRHITFWPYAIMKVTTNIVQSLTVTALALLTT